MRIYLRPKRGDIDLATTAQSNRCQCVEGMNLFPLRPIMPSLQQARKKIHFALLLELQVCSTTMNYNKLTLFSNIMGKSPIANLGSSLIDHNLSLLV